MKRIAIQIFVVCLLAAGGISSAVAQQNNHPTYAVMSLVGDSLTLGPYLKTSTIGRSQTELGTQLNLERWVSVPVTETVYDDTVNAAIANVLRQRLPNAAVDMLATRNAALFGLQGKLLDANDASAQDARESLKALLKERNDDYLILVTKRRSDTTLFDNNSRLFSDVHLRLMNGNQEDDSGKLEGLGFYMDTAVVVQNLDDLLYSHGVLLTYVNARVTLIDAKTLNVIRDLPASKSAIIAASGSYTPNSAWTDVPDPKKFKRLQDLVRVSMTEAVPAVLPASP